jgi:endonuclease/exonuclease/phosphatase (EEP) superfamily protein YafD
MEHGMRGELRVVVAVILVAGATVRAQDVPGIELCMHETRMDRRTGCLQSNIEYLQALIAKNAAAAQQKANAAAGEIAALKADVTLLHATVAALQARLDKLEAAAKPRPAGPGDKPAVKH